MNAIRAGGLYFLVVFACGFVLGAIRVTFVAPATGALAATLIELPLMLAISWWVASRVVEKLKVAAHIGDRLVMGGVGFVLLMVAEFTLGTLLGRSLAEQWHDLGQPPGLVGIGGQIVFGLMPPLITLQKRLTTV